MSVTTMCIARRVGALAIVLGVLAALAACGGEANSAASSKPSVPPRQYGTPDSAAAALVAAAERFDVPALKTVLGSDGAALVQSADSVRDRSDARAFAAQARARQRLDLDSTKTRATLVVGEGEWPLPLPIVQRDGRWAFDPAAGREELLARRIGRNELDAIEVSRGYVEAQRAYALEKHDGARVNQYAQRVISTRGKQDGLAWQAADGSWQGPVGPGIARVIGEGYSSRFQPYHGYYFKILKGQGPHAPMGQMDFVVDSAMIGGFALVAAPAEYRVTGVQTFIVSHDGIVYEKDLGDSTLVRFRAMERYDPDSTWTPVPDA